MVKLFKSTREESGKRYGLGGSQEGKREAKKAHREHCPPWIYEKDWTFSFIEIVSLTKEVLTLRNEIIILDFQCLCPNFHGKNIFLKEIYDLGVGGFLMLQDGCLENLLEIV